MLVAQPKLFVGVPPLEVGVLGSQGVQLSLRSGSGPFPLLKHARARGNLHLGCPQGGGRALEVAPEVRRLLFEALDEGARRLHALRELRYGAPGILVHARPFCGSRRVTLPS